MSGYRQAGWHNPIQGRCLHVGVASHSVRKLRVCQLCVFVHLQIVREVVVSPLVEGCISAVQAHANSGPTSGSSDSYPQVRSRLPSKTCRATPNMSDLSPSDSAALAYEQVPPWRMRKSQGGETRQQASMKTGQRRGTPCQGILCSKIRSSSYRE